MAKRNIIPIEKGRIRLRPLEGSDLAMTLRWRNQDHIRRWFKNSNVITEDQHQAWFKQYQERDDDFFFIVEEIRELNFTESVGQVSLYGIDWSRKSAEFGRLLIGEPDAMGKGIAKSATLLVLQFAFMTLGLEKVELEVFSNNEIPLSIYRSCGFIEVSDSNGLKKMVKIQDYRNAGPKYS